MEGPLPRELIQQDAVLENNDKIIVQILQYLSGSELLEARTLNSTFNQFITSNPDLLWDQNVMVVHVPPTESDWLRVRMHKLVLDHKCPNFHFVKTNLLSPGAVDFFRSALRYQIKYLKLTKCGITWNLLLHILAYCSRTLEYLEIVDFSKMERAEFFKEISTSLQKLKTLIFNNTFGVDDKMINRYFLTNILGGTRSLQNLKFQGWGAKTCKCLVKVLSSIFPQSLQKLEVFELSCRVDTDLTTLQQYSFLKEMESLLLTNLTKFSLRFDRQVEPSVGLTEQFIQELSQIMADLIKESSSTLEIIEFVNCPLSDVVFYRGTNAFPNLRRLNTTGTFVTKLDEDANPVYEFDREDSNRGSDLARRKKLTRQQRCQDLTDMDNPSRSRNQQKSRQYSQAEVYVLVCTTLVSCALLHFALRAIFPAKIAGHWEVFIHAAIALYIFKKQEIQWMLAG